MPKPFTIHKLDQCARIRIALGSGAKGKEPVAWINMTNIDSDFSTKNYVWRVPNGVVDIVASTLQLLVKTHHLGALLNHEGQWLADMLLKPV